MLKDIDGDIGVGCVWRGGRGDSRCLAECRMCPPLQGYSAAYCPPTHTPASCINYKRALLVLNSIARTNPGLVGYQPWAVGGYQPWAGWGFRRHCSPTKMKAFINRRDIDFDMAEELKPVQVPPPTHTRLHTFPRRHTRPLPPPFTMHTHAHPPHTHPRTSATRHTHTPPPTPHTHTRTHAHPTHTPDTHTPDTHTRHAHTRHAHPTHSQPLTRCWGLLHSCHLALLGHAREGGAGGVAHVLLCRGVVVVVVFFVFLMGCSAGPNRSGTLWHNRMGWMGWLTTQE